MPGTMTIYADEWAGLSDDVIGLTPTRVLLFICEFDAPWMSFNNCSI